MAQERTTIVLPSMSEIKNMTIICLQECLAIGTKASALLKNKEASYDTDNKNDPSYLVQCLESEIKKVKYFELRMPIIAPMKAGKSTILNAVVGQDLLPTRNAAMTSIPTEIVLNVTNLEDGKYVEPYLKLQKKFIEQMSKLQDDLCKYLKEKALHSDDLKRKLERHTHLIDTAENIRDKSPKSPRLDTEISGTEHIRSVLTFINDVIRIYECLIRNDAFSDTREFLDVLPRIYAPYIAVGDDKCIHDSLGNLVLVDTPGPNEATTSSFLKEIFYRELEKAAVILVVLNFKSLNTEIDESIAKSIQTIREAKHGNDSLYAIVNQVDQRRKGDMTPQQIQDFVARRFNIGDPDSHSHEHKRVFETQALRALLAKQFLYEMKLYEKNHQNEQFNVAEILCGEDFITEVYGISWNGTATRDQLKSMAAKLWETSGFQLFLYEAIENLIQKAAPNCLKSAINQCRYCNSQLKENLQMRKNAMVKDAAKLHHQIDELKKDSKELEQVMSSQKKTLETATKEVSKFIENHFYQAKANGIKQLNQLFDKANIEDEEFERYIRQGVHSVAGTIGNFIRAYLGAVAQTSFTNMADMVTEIARLRLSNTLRFQNKDEADDYVQRIQRRVTVISENTLANVQATINTEYEKLCNNLNQKLKQTTEEILIRAQKRLMETFDLNILRPHSFKTDIEIQSRIEYKVQKEFRPWWLLWLVEIPDTEGNQDASSYTVHLGALEQQ
ncbi:unnamed protein product, partial [Rotaria sordida]